MENRLLMDGGGVASAAPMVMHLVLPAARAWGPGKAAVRPRKPEDEKVRWRLGATVALLRPAQAVCGLLEMACWHWYWPCQVAPHAPCPWLLPCPCPRRVAQPLACARVPCCIAPRHGLRHSRTVFVPPLRLARWQERAGPANAVWLPRLCHAPDCNGPFALPHLQRRICNAVFAPTHSVQTQHASLKGTRKSRHARPE